MNEDEVKKKCVPRNPLSLKLQRRLKKVGLYVKDTAESVKEKIRNKFMKRYLVYQ